MSAWNRIPEFELVTPDARNMLSASATATADSSIRHGPRRCPRSAKRSSAALPVIGGLAGHRMDVGTLETALGCPGVESTDGLGVELDRARGAGRAHHLGSFGLDELLEDEANDVTDEIHSVAGTERARDLRDVTLGQDHRGVLLLVSPARNTPRIAPMAWSCSAYVVDHRAPHAPPPGRTHISRPCPYPAIDLHDVGIRTSEMVGVLSVVLVTWKRSDARPIARTESSLRSTGSCAITCPVGRAQ